MQTEEYGFGLFIGEQGLDCSPNCEDLLPQLRRYPLLPRLHLGRLGWREGLEICGSGPGLLSTPSAVETREEGG